MHFAIKKDLKPTNKRSDTMRPFIPITLGIFWFILLAVALYIITNNMAISLLVGIVFGVIEYFVMKKTLERHRKDEN